MLVQYFWWLKGMLTGDMGVSVQQNITVANYIKPRIMTTLFLGVYSIVLGLLIAVPLAVFQAYRRDSDPRQGGQLLLVPLRGRRRRSCSARWCILLFVT